MPPAASRGKAAPARTWVTLRSVMEMVERRAERPVAIWRSTAVQRLRLGDHVHAPQSRSRCSPLALPSTGCLAAAAAGAAGGIYLTSRGAEVGGRGLGGRGRRAGPRRSWARWGS